jgi:hypothetical protein
VLVAAWATAAVLLALSGRAHLRAAESLLPEARDAVVSGDLGAAATTVRDAHQELAAAATALGNGALRPLEWLPVVGPDLRTVRTVAVSGELVTGAALELVDGFGEDPAGMGGLAPVGGAFPVDRLERFAHDLRTTATATETAVADIAATRPSGRVAEVTTGRDRVLELLEPLAARSRVAADVAEQLPAFLGADGPRRYLFGAATPAELRGTGGFVGSVAILSVDEGRLDFGAFVSSSDLEELPGDAFPVPAEQDVERWRRYGDVGLWVNLNRTPDFPSAAEAMLRHWEVSEGTRLDGMLVADPFAFEALLALSGPTDVPGFGVTLDAGTVVSFVANEAYDTFEDPFERKEVLGAVAAATFGRFLEGDLEAPPQQLIGAFGDLIAHGHLLAYASDPDLQQAFERAGLAGRLGASEGDRPGEYLSVVANSGTASKVDFYADRQVVLESTLLTGGAARSELFVRVANDAPTEGITGYVIGPNNPTLDVGDNLIDLSVYLAPNAVFTRVPPPADGPTFTETELGHPVHDGWVRIPSGTAVERTYAWRTADAWELTEDGEVLYDLLVQGQTVIRPTELTIRVRVPDGLELVDPPDGVAVEEGVAVWRGSIRGEDVRLPLRFRSPARPDRET